MNSITKFLIILLSFFSMRNLSGQSLYVRINTGYEFSLAGQTYPQSGDKFSTTYSKYSLANGVLPMISIGYMFNKNIGVDLGVGYLNGKKYNIYDSNPSFTPIIQASSYLLQPTINLCSGMDDKVSTYARIGLSIALNPSGTIPVELIDNSGSVTPANAMSEYSTSVGFCGAAGLNIKLIKNLYLNTEFHLMVMSIYIRSITYNGATINFSNTNGAGTQPITSSQPYSNIGAALGLKYFFYKRS